MFHNSFIDQYFPYLLLMHPLHCISKVHNTFTFTLFYVFGVGGKFIVHESVLHGKFVAHEGSKEGTEEDDV